jgi:hypothetical protein
VQRHIDALTSSEIQDQQLMVSETVHHRGFLVRVASTAERELMGLVSHSIHHLAIIPLLAEALGHSVDQNFGKAPSTFVFKNS